MRQSTEPGSIAYALWDEIPSGTAVEVISTDGKWSRIRAGGKKGWMMSEFLRSDLPPDSNSGADGGDDGEMISVGRARLEKLHDELGDILGLRG